MPYDPQKHHRRSIRLKGYDYSQSGFYFITICIQNRLCLLGRPLSGRPSWSPNEEEWSPNDSEEGRPSWSSNQEGRPSWSSQDEGRPQVSPRQEEEGRPQGPPRREPPQQTAAGKMVEQEWLNLPERFPNIRLHAFVVMPDHFHAILEICEKGDKTVGDIVGAFQSIVTVKYIRGVKELGWPPFPGKLWQRDYWERIIRNQREFDNITNYIIENPGKY